MSVNNRIEFADGTSLPCAEANGIPCINRVYEMSGEQYFKIHLQATVEEIVAKFQDGASCVHKWNEETLTVALNEDGSPDIDENFVPRMVMSVLTHSEALVDYAVMGDIILARDGTTYVMVRDRNELELTQAALDSAMLRILTGGN